MRLYQASISAAALGLALCFLAALPSASQNTHGSPSDALVTFYSNRITTLGGLPGHRWGAFKGRLFDSGDQLTFIEPAHFVTFRVVPGMHLFTANSWVSKHSDQGAHITMQIQAGHRYFIETGTFATGPIFGIRDVSCQFAQSEGANLKPLESAHVRPAGKQIAVQETAFPGCPANDSP